MSIETGSMLMNYCESMTAYVRRKSRVVNIGDVPLGGDYPIRVQSMTTTDTLDTIGTVEQSIRMIEAGCEYVRITAPSLKEAENLQNIKNELRKRGYKTPLVADIHFTPNAAEVAARIVEKVRVNPGNYADKKKFEHIEYTDETYNTELERIHQRFVPLIKICKEHGTAMRIGANHGSLSDRIMSRYGDTPLGMVESALEFLRICEAHDYKQIVLSMKSSNPLVMVQAYRLLIEKMNAEGMNYPLHLGVTEAGEGEDGRIKSAAGIGTLLEDGIGDTVRVSLTEDPEFEIPVAKMLVGRYNNRAKHNPIPPIIELPYSPTQYTRRETREPENIGGKNHPRVVADLSGKDAITQATLFGIGHSYNANSGIWKSLDQGADYVYTGKQIISFTLPESLKAIYDSDSWKQAKQGNSYPFFSSISNYESSEKSSSLNFVSLKIGDIANKSFDKLNKDETLVWVVETTNQHAMAEERRILIELLSKKYDTPVIIKRQYETALEDEVRLFAATDAGSLLIDGMGEGIWLKANIPVKSLNSIAFGILQATRTRISKTEYISCPSCGRTLFNLQQVTAQIHERTSHLKGVKIGIMGCVVNGPGEMADADYGYVGTGVGKITLYKGKQVVQRNIASEQAVDALITLIKDGGDWVEKPSES
ncbi:MAG TPA: (E)-4-hydroxy-3-methylbut-2-enyl-diphosphate synthase [Bacteroidia bacterium]|jgi:(E)-4-hydroxy-3-methylbut-2-enyl-diphosphate synthase|nr:(E)-4-hydroxy-3-methylbut-2-enyl-diphosphate synthase [Bacteroidia bacterium]